jgi:hypothetical protein
MSRILAITLFTAALGLACATSSEPEVAPEPEPVVEAVPERSSAPEAVAVNVAEPTPARQLPKTASVLPLVGLTGVAALGLGSVTRVARRRMTGGR